MATTEERLIVREDSNKGSAPVAAGVKIPGGTLVFAIAAGFATNVVNAGANTLLGVAHNTADNAGGANGDEIIEFWRREKFQFTLAGVTQADLNKKVYAIDNDTLTLTAANHTYVGTIAEIVDGNTVMVDLDPLAQ
ncbi:MAG: hypothetical protein AAFX06_21810 [Planctomycetota bacterium]